MRPAIILALVTAFAVAAILYLLHRLGGFQHTQGQQAPTTLFLRRWSYILSAENYTEPGRRLLPWLRVSLGVLAVSVIAAIVSLIVFVRRHIP